MKKAILAIFAVLLITPIVIYFVFPGVLYKASLRMERKKAGLEKRMISVQDHEIVYLEGGKGDTIVLVHGFGCHKDYWTQFAKYLTPEFHVVALDVPGFVEIGVIHPPIFSGAALDALFEPRDREEALCDGRLKLIEVDRPPKCEKSHNDHRIGWPVHAQPRHVHG